MKKAILSFIKLRAKWVSSKDVSAGIIGQVWGTSSVDIGRIRRKEEPYHSKYIAKVKNALSELVVAGDLISAGNSWAINRVHHPTAIIDVEPVVKEPKVEKPLKQVIVMRVDLNMSVGKMLSQAMHATMGFMFRFMAREFSQTGTITLTNSEWKWVGEPTPGAGETKKVVLAVKSEEQLLKIHKKAKDAGLNSYLVTDAGKTEFKEPTNTCLAIGPDYDEKIDKITGDLPLLKEKHEK